MTKIVVYFLEEKKTKSTAISRIGKFYHLFEYQVTLLNSCFYPIRARGKTAGIVNKVY